MNEWLLSLILTVTSIADQLRSLLPQTKFDISKLIHFLDSRKDTGIIFSIPPITAGEQGFQSRDREVCTGHTLQLSVQ